MSHPIGLDFSEITPYLFVGRQPYSADYDLLRGLGVRLILNMRRESPPVADPHDPPLASLWLPTIDSPFFPLPLAKLADGVRAALPVFESGSAVYVHCAYGRHRGPAMAACILVAQGYSVKQAITIIRTARPYANPDIFYIRWRIQHFALYWDLSGRRLTSD